MKELEEQTSAVLELSVYSAKYGLGEGQYRDVTAIVRALVKNGRLEFMVVNENLGGADPFPGRRKHLVITYSVHNGAEQTATCFERDWVSLPKRRPAV